VEKNGLATGVAMAIVTGDALDTIDADDMSSAAQDVLLVYPFLGADNVEKASWELPLCDTGDDFTTSQLITNQLEKSVGRNHIETITQFDRYSLYDNQFVNNIDFWMLYLSRNCSQGASSEYFFTSHFYSKLI
jgi:glycosyltransferase involved in cell wall biosynthesis